MESFYYLGSRKAYFTKYTFARNLFFIKNKLLQAVIEVGDEDKGFGQIAGQEHSFVVADDIESAYERKIPLWAFGFLVSFLDNYIPSTIHCLFTLPPRLCRI